MYRCTRSYSDKVQHIRPLSQLAPFHFPPLHYSIARTSTTFPAPKFKGDIIHFKLIGAQIKTMPVAPGYQESRSLRVKWHLQWSPALAAWKGGLTERPKLWDTLVGHEDIRHTSLSTPRIPPRRAQTHFWAYSRSEACIGSIRWMRFLAGQFYKQPFHALDQSFSQSTCLPLLPP